VLHVLTWAWGSKYGGHYASRLASAVARNLVQPHRFMVCAPAPADQHLTKIEGCFARLRAFDPAWQRAHGINAGDRILNLDLDLVVTGRLDPLVNRSDPFVILQGVNAANPCPYNGSAWMLTAGHRPDVWSSFDIEAAGKVPFYAFPDDQAWFAAKLPDAGAWGPADGVYGFHKPGWPGGDDLPSGARLVAFFGKRDPAQFEHLNWVKAHWR
jgi:hypothetical protein